MLLRTEEASGEASPPEGADRYAGPASSGTLASHLSVPVTEPMDDDTTPADRAGMDVERLDARIEEIERRMEQDRERLETLRARKQRRTAVADGERRSQQDAAAIVLDHARSEDVGAPVPVPDLLDVVTAREDIDRETAEEGLETLLRRGEVYEPADGEVRVT